MASLSITPPFPIFSDRDGTPLEDGYIWIGTANQDARTNPIAVYWNNILTEPAAQPIRTLGGYPSRFGTPGQLFISAQVYSILVQDKRGTLVYSDQAAEGPSTFVNFSVSEEIIIATAGQTVFNLANTYTPGTNSLTVFVDGVNQYYPGAYVETNGNTVTFTSGLHEGAEVKFTTAIQLSGGATDASQVSYQPAGAGAVSTSVQTKLRESVSVQDFGADPTGVADSTAAIQAAWDAIKSANGTLYFPAGTYRCDSVLDFTVDYVSTNHFHAVVGECATLDFSNTGLTTGNMITFGSGAGFYEEKSRFVMEGLSLIGPALGTITPTSTPPHTLVGIFFNYAINLTLRNITVTQFYIGYKVDFCFPIVAEAVLSDNCYVGLQLVADVTCSSWVGCSFKEGRFGVVIQPKTNTKNIYGQTFIRPLLEGNDVAMVIDPLDGGGVGAWDINVIDPYLENVDYDGFRIGRAIDYDDATATGADRSRNVFNVRITGGLWDGQWGTAGHEPVLFHAADTAAAPAGCVVDIPVQLSTSSVGYARKSQLNNRIDVYQGATSVISSQAQYQQKATSLSITDGVSAPSTEVGFAQIYVDTADGDLKIKFGDGTVKTIVVDT